MYSRTLCDMEKLQMLAPLISARLMTDYSVRCCSYDETYNLYRLLPLILAGQITVSAARYSCMDPLPVVHCHQNTFFSQRNNNYCSQPNSGYQSTNSSYHSTNSGYQSRRCL